MFRNVVVILVICAAAFAHEKKQCKPKQTPSPTTNNSVINSEATSSANSESNSSSVSSAIAEGGSAEATGGSVKNSGNSSNTNTNVAEGGKGGAGGTAQQTQQQSNNSSGNDTTLNYKQERNTPLAYAPDAIPTSPCVKGYSGGATGPMFGASVGGGKVDKGCDSRELARQFALLGNRKAAAKVLCSTDAAKRAGLTFDDCLDLETEK